MTTSRRLAPLPLLLIGLAVLAALVLIPWVVHAQTLTNQDATGRPVVLASAEGAGILFADTEGIADGNGLPISGTNFTTFTWNYQWIRVDGGTQTNVGANSASYQPVEADVGNKIKVRVSFRDGNNFSEAVTSLPFGPIAELTRTSAPPSTLVSNTGQSASADADITQQYAQGFRLGNHGQGYEISSVSIELAAVPSSLTVSLWSGAVEGGHSANAATKLFDFADPSSLAVGLNKFTAPAGAFAYQGVNYFIVLSGFGTTLKIKETTSDDEDTGGETGAVIYDKAAVRALSDTGPWGISGSRTSVLRLAVEGSRRASGILASNYAQPKIDDKGTDDTSDDTGLQQEVISVGDKIGFGFELGAANRYLIRGVSFNMDDSTSLGSGFTNPFDLRSGSRTGPKQFSLTNTRKAAGLPVWTAPQGATVAGGCPTVMSVKTCKEYVFDQPVGEDTGDENKRRRDAVLSRVAGNPSDGVDDPPAAGVNITGAKGDVALNDPLMALLGEPLDAMVQNLGRSNNGYASADTTNDVLSQGFTTGPARFGYRLQGIGVNIEGSGSNYPDGPTSVSVAVHADSSGKPGTKLVDLVSPTEYAAGHSFFEAPPGTYLKGSTSYVLVWRHLGGTVHRLQRTSSDSEDAGALVDFLIANVFYRGADLDNLSANSGSNALEIAVYGKSNQETNVVFIMEPPPPPPPPPFIPGVTGGGGAILRCSVPPAESCPTYEDDPLPAEFTFLSATMTVETLNPVSVGYSSLSATLDDMGSLDDTTFSLGGTDYTIQALFGGSIQLVLNLEDNNRLGDAANDLVLHVGTQTYAFADATYSSSQNAYAWFSNVPTWPEGDSVAVKITGPHPTPNAYGYRTIWTALMTAEVNPNVATRFGYAHESYGKITNDTIVNGRDETVTIGTVDQPRFPWTGYVIESLVQDSFSMDLRFLTNDYPTAAEVAGWTLSLGGGIELPFAKATNHALTPGLWSFNYDPGWADGDQVLVSIHTKDVQNRFGQVALKAGRSTSTDGDSNLVYGKVHSTYARGSSRFGPGGSWELKRLRVTTDKTGDTDPVWITATFRTPDAGTGYQAWWEGQFEDFHTLFLRWIYHEGGIGKGAATYTLPLTTAATEGSIQRSRSNRDISFTWVRTYKEFQRRHLDLANHSDINADMLAPPKPATARSTTSIQNTGSQHGLYTPAPTVTSVEITSNPGDDQTYGPGDVIQATLTFDQEVTVRYTGSKRQAASVQLEMNGETKTAYYERTEGKKVIFEYTVLPGDEAPVALKLPLNSLKLFSERGRQDGSIRNSEGADAVLDHNGLLSTKHRVDAVEPEFSSAQVSTDGAQVMVTLTEDIKSPSILRAFGIQTGLLQSLALDVWVDDELPARSDATVSGDTVTLTMAEPITQGQTVTVSYDNLSTNSERIFSDLYGNNLPAFTKQPATNHSTVADVTQPGGGLALSRTDLIIKEGDTGTYTVVLTSQPSNDVTVSVDDHPPGRATVSPTSLTFTADTWNTPQTVTITSTEDSNYIDRWVILRHTATGDNYRATAAAWLKLRDNYNLTTTTPNTPATGSPTINGTPEVGQTLTLDISSIADAEGLTNASYTYLYQWLRNGAEIRDATDTYYTLVDADEGKVIKVKVSFTDDANNAESRTSAATVAVAPRPNSPPTGAPTINGTPQVGRTLMVDTSKIADADGMETAVFRYQWLAATDFATLEFHGENSPTYTLGPLSKGLAIKVKVSFTDDRGHSETLTSDATEVVAAAEPNSDPTGLPTISGTPRVDETLTADTSAINDANGLTNVSYTYVWMGTQVVVDETSGISYTIGFQSPDQTGPTYALTLADQGATIKVRVTFTDDDGYQESLTSAATEPVAARPNTEATGAPTISGTPQVDETLTADVSGIGDEDGLTNVSYRYQWLAGGSDIEDATSSSYLLTASEQGQAIQVKVTFTDDADNEETLTSEATVEVAAAPNRDATGLPTISGTPQVEQTLTADTSGISDANGLNNVSYQYQWLRDDADIAGQTNSTYELVSADEGKTIKVRVTFNDDAGNAESLTSTATTAVLARSAPVDALTASFANMPADHNGENFTFQLTFSENVDAGYARIRNHALTVTGATTDNASRTTQGSNQGWNVEVNPTGNGAVTITLPETTDCSDAGAICTDDSRKLSRSTSATVAGPPAISVSDATVQEAEGAVLVFTATLSHASSRTVTVSYATSDGTAVAGSDYTAASGALTFNAGDTSQTVQVTVLTDSEDESQETLTLTLSNPSQATLDDATGTGAIENGESSSGTQEDPPAEDPPAVLLTASFANVPADHNGSNFTFQLTFSENVKAGYARIQDHAFTVSGGTIDSASRKTQGSNQSWNVQVNPTGSGAVSITLPETTDCDASGAICTDDSRKLSHPTSATVAGPPAISVSDATVQEAEGAVLVFTATLSHASSRTVTVDYATSDGTAVAGSDYTAASGALTFNAGDTSQTVQVTVLTDSEDEGQETLTLTLSNPSQATLDDATGTGTIENGESSSGTQEDPPAEDPPVVLLTASFANVPADHDGGNFTFDLNFSENVNAGYARIRDDAFTVSGGTIASASRKTQGNNQGWTVEVDPTGNGAVSITLPETTDCDASGAICTDDSRKLSHPTSATVAGPPAISVSDATVQEAEGAVLVFTATLSHASSRTVTVGYATSDGTAVAGSDYTAASGTLTFNAGDTSQTVQVTVLTDSEDEGQEALTLTLSNPSQATLDDATGTGTIENGESSSSTVVNSPPNGLPTVSGTPQVGETLTTDTSAIADEDGQTNVSYSYQWIRSEDGNADTDIEDATDSTYTLTGGDVGKTIQVKVTFTDDADNQESLTSAATAAVAVRPNTPATGLPTISGTAQVDETLTADVSSIADADGLTNVSYSYQWIRNDGGTDADIAGETASTHTLVSADVGKTIKVRVSFTDDAGNEETLTSAATAAVAVRPNTPATGLPTISGTVQVDETLTADTSGISDADGLTNVSYSYQWIRNDGTNDSDMGGQTGSTYTLVSADEGKAIKVRVSFTDDAGNEETLTSAATAAVAVRPNTPATGLPTISGTAQVDETLTADTSGISHSDGLTNVSYSYQWIRNDGTNDADIGGQTGSTYTLTDEDVGKTIKVRVSFTDDAGNEETLTSAATAAVAVRPNTPATGLPTISGTAQVGKTLTANISGMADEDGLDNAEFSYQWLANDADIQNATDSTYTLTDDDVGKTIKVRVSFTDDRSNDETLTSAATDTVVAKPDSPDTDAPPRDPGTTVDVTVGNTVTGEIEEAIEVDWFKVSLLASETYQIDMRGAWGGEWARIDGEIVWVAPGTLHDPKLLGVFSAANVLVPGTDEEVSGDDRGDYEEGKNSRITSFSPPADGYYYIAAAAEAAWTGTYELTVTVVADE